MGEAGREQVIAGIAAAEGLAIGTIVLDTLAPCGTRRVGSRAAEEQALKSAIGRSQADLERLIESEDKLAAEILEFQAALLEDEDLIDPILAAVAEGRAAHDAWGAALDREIADYRDGGEDYLAARADDLKDLKIRVLGNLAGRKTAGRPVRTKDGILVADDLTPSRFLELDWTRFQGAAIRGGSPTSHVAILARARGVPLVVGLEAELSRFGQGTPVILDAEHGKLIVAPSASTVTSTKGRLDRRDSLRRAADQFLDKPAVTEAGEAVRVLINLDDPSALESIPPEHCDGIGLARTEFLFHGRALPGDDEQLAVYRRIVDWAKGRPVTIRTLDAGGDKPIPGVTLENESNPFLGLRGLRLSLTHPDLLRTQFRALARAAAAGPLKVMLPMVTVPEELRQARLCLEQAVDDLRGRGLAHDRPPLGMMVEVPAAALTAEDFDADFYSIGSNDLIQYVTAAARDNPKLSDLADPGNPAVLELISRTVTAGRARGVEVSLCGDMASEPGRVAALLDCGLRTLSVAPAQLGRVKLAVSQYPAREARDG